MRFIDTNVLVYAYDSRDPHKQQIAADVLLHASEPIALSAQVLSEFYVTVTRKLAQPLSPEQAAAEINLLSKLPVVPTDVALIQAAVETTTAAQISYWDALIVEAAVRAGCDRLVTEDLADGSVIRGVRIENPFR